MSGANIVLNAGGNITPASISGGTFELNAGFPDHTVFGKAGTVTLTDIDVTNLTIWCLSINSPSGTKKDISVKVELYTDDNTPAGSAAIFLDDCDTLPSSVNQKNELRLKSIEFGPVLTSPNYEWIDSTDGDNWDTVIEADGSKNIYITGAITVPAAAITENLTFKTGSGKIVFNGTYNAAGHDLTLITTGGKIEQPNAASKITADNLIITTSVGGTVTLTQNNEVKNLKINSAAGDVEFKNNINLEISGISAGANAVNLTVNGNIDLTGNIIGTKTVSLNVSGDIDLTGNISASSVSIQAGSINGSGTVNSTAGDISFVRPGSAAVADSVSLKQFNASGNIIVSTAAKDIVYYSSATPSTPPSGGTWSATSLFVEANSAYNKNVILRTQGSANNIYLVDVIDSSQKKLTVDSNVGTGANGFIEFYMTSTSANAYKYTGTNTNHLDLLPGAGGVRIEKAVVDITGKFDINNNKLTLRGSGKSSIKAANIILGDITATTLNADIIALEASGYITLNGNVTAKQLIAKAPNGTVSVKAITIDSSNTGNEGEDAAIYILANTFAVTTATPNSIVPGGTGGQLCLNLQIRWTGPYDVVDGPEDDAEDIGSEPGARWHQHYPGSIPAGKILYSFTEDSNGNGRLDRIRVQTNKTLNGDFTGFSVSVVGYVVKGYGLVSLETSISDDDDSFYIYLEEKNELDGGNTPHWSITRNTSLKDNTNAPINDMSQIQYIDTIPPRIAYTLTLPGNPQTYVHMSEPVVSTNGTISAFFGDDDYDAQPAVSANFGYLFKYINSYPADVFANFKNIYNDSAPPVPNLSNGYFKISDIVDKGKEPTTEDSKFPPRYPIDWGYTAYAKSNNTPAGPNVFIPPHNLLTVDMMIKLADGDGDQVTPTGTSTPVIRRVTDVLISMTPNAAGDNYFAWPTFAKPSGGKSITDFDGTDYLEKDSIEKNGLDLQARISNSLTITPITPTLFWTTADIPVSMRNPKIGGLWLPNVLDIPSNQILYYYAPLSSDNQSKLGVNVPSSKLYNYNITDKELANSGSKFEFIFRLNNSDMFAARLDSKTIPADWYTLVRPFGFTIQGMNLQRGGVTILNNVINSDKKEPALIRYDLMRSGRVTVQIYTLDGTLVKSIRRNEQRETGSYVDTWDGSNNGGRAVARGMYFVRVVGPDIDEIRKIMVVK